MWHKRIYHFNYQRLQDLQSKQVVFGLPEFSGQKAQICEAYQLGKQHQLPFPNKRNRSRNNLDLIHLEVWGPAHNVSLGNSRYFVYNKIYLIEKKSEVFDYFWNFKSLVERETERKIKCLWSDGGKGYFSSQFNCYFSRWEFKENLVAYIRRSKTA